MLNVAGVHLIRPILYNLAMKKGYIHITHPFGPLFREDSTILILGSFPSVKSREEMFFYGNVRNRFWSVISAVFGEAAPVTTEQKKEFLYRNRIALYDVIEECDILGSSDSSIRNVIPSDISSILEQTEVTRVFTNGKTAYSLYQKLIYPLTGMNSVYLPSTSPANAAWSMDELITEWRKAITENT